jgi:hypothetical protein
MEASMRLRPCLSSAALAVALLTTSAHFNVAQAQKAALLAPLTPWALTKVGSTEDGQGGYCAMARRFGQNTILTFARNDGDEASVALDFQAPRLTTGENIKIVLDPGAGEQRSYYISPISNQAFVVRLGKDEKFFMALETTGYLRIEAAGKSYNFNLADIDVGQTKLVSCLDSIDEPESMEQASAAPDDGSVHSEIETLRRDVQGLRKENKRLENFVEKTANPDDDVAEEMSNEANTLERENKQLRSKTGVSAGQVDGGEIQANHLTRENRRLQNELAALSLGGEDNVVVHEKITTLEQQNQALRSDLSKGPDTKEWRQSQAELFTIKQENERLQRLLAEKSGSMALVENLESQVHSLQSENKKLMRVALNDIGPAAGEPETATDASPPAMKDLLPVPADASPFVAKDPQQKIEVLMAQIREKDAKLVELSNLTTEVQSLKAKNAALEKELLESAKDKETIAGLNEKIKKLEEENATLKAQGGGATADQVAALEKLTKENTDLKQQIKTLKSTQTAQAPAAEGATCTTEVNKAREEADVARQAELQGLAKENMVLREKLAKLGVNTAPAPEQPAPPPSPEPQGDRVMAREPDPLAPPPLQEVIVSEPPQVSEGATEAQRQEAEMMQSMGVTPTPSVPQEAASQASTQRDVIHWNETSQPSEPPQHIAQQETPPPAPQPKSSRPAPVLQQAPVQQQPAPMQQPAPVRPQAPAAQQGFSIPDVLVSAQIVDPGQIQKVEKASGNGRYAYQWHSGAVYGSAEQKPIASAAGFDGEVDQYLSKTKKRCPGDFAASPNDNLENGPDRIASYEIACVGKNIDSSASLLFVNKGGTFTVVAHETSSDKMADAMTLRDKVLKVITGQ